MDDTALKELLTADAAPADPRFVLAVMARIEPRRFRRDLAATIGLGATAILLLALVMPAVDLTGLVSSQTGNLAILAVLGAVTLLLPQLVPARD